MSSVEGRVDRETDMKKRITVLILCALLFALCSHAEAQQQGKVPKIGWLSPGSAASTARIDLFLREFRKLGYVEGKNVTFERRSADDQLARLAGLADELVRQS